MTSVEAALVTLSVTLFVSLFLLGAVTLIAAVARSLYDRRLEAAEKRVKGDVLGRLGDDDGWDAWADDLSWIERRAAESLLEGYLRNLTGVERDSLRRLGEALGINERAAQRIGSRKPRDRLDAMRWLTLLEAHVPTHEVVSAATGPRTRAAAARLLHERGDDETATYLLLSADSSLSVYGIDTLYDANVSDSDPLHERAADESEEWSEDFLVQVLTVVRETKMPVDSGAATWILRYLGHGSPEVRAAATRSLGSFGWNTPLREGIEIRSLVEDPSHKVRRAAYETLADWGDDASLLTLAFRVAREEDDRARLAAVRLLQSQGEGAHRLGAENDPAWRWVEARSEVNA